MDKGPSSVADVVKPTDNGNGAVLDFSRLEPRSWQFDAINYQFARDKNLTGKGITIAVIDTGIAQDHDAIAHAVHSQSTHIFKDITSFTLADRDGHGTAIASLIAGIDAKQGELYGVAPESKILSVGVSDPASTNAFFEASDVAKGIEYAVRNNAQIINLSMGSQGSDTDDIDVQAISHATENDVIVVLATGNGGSDKPASGLAYFVGSAIYNDLAIAVTAIENNNWKLASFASPCSVFDPNFCIAVPGVNVLQASNSEGNQGIEFGSGTSQATAIASGAVALLLQAFPNLSKKEVVQILLLSADDIGATGVDPVYGAGLLNLQRALEPLGEVTLENSQTLRGTAVICENSSACDSLLRTQSFKAVPVKDEFGRRYQADLRNQVFQKTTQWGYHVSENSTDIQLAIDDLYGFDRFSVHIGKDQDLNHSKNTLKLIEPSIAVSPFADLLNFGVRLERTVCNVKMGVSYATHFQDATPSAQSAKIDLMTKNGAHSAGMAFAYLHENNQIMGLRLAGAFGEIEHTGSMGGSLFYQYQRDHWSAFAKAGAYQSRVQMTHSNGIITAFEDALFTELSFGAGYDGVIKPHDRLEIGAQQTLAPSRGKMKLNSDVVSNPSIDLKPSSREWVIELGYKLPINQNWALSLNLASQINPQNQKAKAPNTAISFATQLKF